MNFSARGAAKKRRKKILRQIDHNGKECFATQLFEAT
jgi:hypothetical protein